MTETLTPFGGFYNSLHDSEIDREIEIILSDESRCETNAGLQNH